MTQKIILLALFFLSFFYGVRENAYAQNPINYYSWSGGTIENLRDYFPTDLPAYYGSSDGDGWDYSTVSGNAYYYPVTVQPFPDDARYNFKEVAPSFLIIDPQEYNSGAYIKIPRFYDMGSGVPVMVHSKISFEYLENGWQELSGIPSTCLTYFPNFDDASYSFPMYCVPSSDWYYQKPYIVFLNLQLILSNYKWPYRADMTNFDFSHEKTLSYADFAYMVYTHKPYSNAITNAGYTLAKEDSFRTYIANQHWNYDYISPISRNYAGSTTIDRGPNQGVVYRQNAGSFMRFYSHRLHNGSAYRDEFGFWHNGYYNSVSAYKYDPLIAGSYVLKVGDSIFGSGGIAEPYVPTGTINPGMEQPGTGSLIIGPGIDDDASFFSRLRIIPTFDNPHPVTPTCSFSLNIGQSLSCAMEWIAWGFDYLRFVLFAIYNGVATAINAMASIFYGIMKGIFAIGEMSFSLGSSIANDGVYNVLQSSMSVNCNGDGTFTLTGSGLALDTSTGSAETPYLGLDSIPGISTILKAMSVVVPVIPNDQDVVCTYIGNKLITYRHNSVVDYMMIMILTFGILLLFLHYGRFY